MSDRWLTGVLRGSVATPASPSVVKVGGSLLRRPAWDRELAAMLDGLPTARLVVVGGGPLVDGLRAIDLASPQSADRMHRLAIDCMGLTARVVAAALGVPLVGEPADQLPPLAVLDAPAWLVRTAWLDRLPVGWHVTSDSIAAVVAAELARRLVLVKSVPPPPGDLDQLVAAGWVDAWFPTAARSLESIRWTAPAPS